MTKDIGAHLKIHAQYTVYSILQYMYCVFFIYKIPLHLKQTFSIQIQCFTLQLFPVNGHNIIR